MNVRLPVALLSIAAGLLLLPSLALAGERALTVFDGSDSLRWQTVNDGVMGGRSQGDSSPTANGTLLFKGKISLENNGGFSSIRTRPQDLKLGGYDGLQVRVRGDGRTYKLALRTRNTSWALSYWADFETRDGEWSTVRIPFTTWVPTSFGRKLPGPKLDPGTVNSVGFMLYDKKAGPFRLEVDSIEAYSRSATPPTVVATGSSPTIVQAAKASGNFTTLLAAAEAAGLVDALSGPGPLTVFAPSDEAFSKLPEGTVESLLEPKNRKALRTVLLHHVIQGEESLSDLLRTSSLTTLSGQRVAISRDGGALRVGEATVTSAGLTCENGVIHVVDRVILPELRDLTGVAAGAKTFTTLVAAAKAAGLLDALTGDTQLTVFAPTDDAFAKLPKGMVGELLETKNLDMLKRILLHHVVAGRIYAADAAAAGKASTLARTELAFGYSDGLQVDGTRVVGPNVQALNGVIHVIDEVLMPPNVRASAKSTPMQKDAALAAKKVIRIAIDAGVRLFNDGNPEDCCAVYEVAATALLSMDENLFSSRVRTQLQAALDSTEAADTKAWTLRRALDAAHGEVFKATS